MGNKTFSILDSRFGARRLLRAGKFLVVLLAMFLEMPMETCYRDARNWSGVFVCNGELAYSSIRQMASVIESDEQRNARELRIARFLMVESLGRNRVISIVFGDGNEKH